MIKQDYQQYQLKSSFCKLIQRPCQSLGRMLTGVFFKCIVRPILFTEKLTDFFSFLENVKEQTTGGTKDFRDYVVAVFCKQYFMHYLCTISFYAIQKKIVIYSCHLMQKYKMFRANSAFFQFDKKARVNFNEMRVCNIVNSY